MYGSSINDNSDFSRVPLEVIAKGRGLVEILAAYITIHKRCREVATVSGKSDDEIFAEAMHGAVYRIYLLGVEDGMRQERTPITNSGGDVPPPTFEKT